MPNLLPTVGRTIHWLDANATREREIFVTGLDYGPNVDTAILGRDYTEGDPFNTRVLPAPGTSWHYHDDHPKIAKPLPL